MGDEPRYLIIPAAGLGIRMQSVSATIPKELLPVGGKPSIQYTVAEGLSAGIRNIVIIINEKKEIIRRYFEDRTFAGSMFPRAMQELEIIAQECFLTFIYQREPHGEFDAVSYARDIVKGHPLAILYPDNIYFPHPGALKMLIHAYEAYNEDITALMTVREEYEEGIGNAGRVDVLPIEDNIFRIERFHPKGTGHFVSRFAGNIRTCGMSISGPHIFDYIERVRGAIPDGELCDVPVRALMLEERCLLGCRLPGIVFDIGNPKGYDMSVNYLDHIEKQL